MYNDYSDFIYNDPFIRTFMMNNINNNQNLFVDANEGFLRGNMQKGAYVPYKGMNYIKPTFDNERKKDLYELQKVCFAAHDTNLYLDTHPNDNNMINLYNQYILKENELERKYEEKYGPLNLSDGTGLNVTPWSWVKNPWPWNK